MQQPYHRRPQGRRKPPWPALLSPQGPAHTFLPCNKLAGVLLTGKFLVTGSVQGQLFWLILLSLFTKKQKSLETTGNCCPIMVVMSCL